MKSEKRKTKPVSQEEKRSQESGVRIQEIR